MKQKLQKWFAHNLLLKLVALLIAVIMWFTFYNMEDPNVEASFIVPVEVQNLEEFRAQGHYIALDGEEDLDGLRVEVEVWARKSIIDELKTRAVDTFLTAYVDVYELTDSSANRLLIHYEVTDRDYEDLIRFNELSNKSYYEADIDDNITKEIEVRYTITGKPEEGYMHLADDANIQVTPETISVTGPASHLENIEYGMVSVRIEDATENINKKGNIVLYNSSGDVISYSRDLVDLSVDEAGVFVPIYMIKSITLLTPLTGAVPDGYEYGKDIESSIKKIEVYGQQSVLSKVNSLDLPTIDLSELTSNYKKKIDLAEVLSEAYPKGEIQLTENNETTTTVSFTVGKQEETTVEVDTANIMIYGKNDNWNFDFTSDTLQFDIIGLRKNLNEFSTDSLVMSVRMKEENYTSGKHKMDLEISGLGDVALKDGKITVEIEITPVQ